MRVNVRLLNGQHVGTADVADLQRTDEWVLATMTVSGLYEAEDGEDLRMKFPITLDRAVIVSSVRLARIYLRDWQPVELLSVDPASVTM